MKGCRIGLNGKYPTRIINSNPSFDFIDKCGIGQQLLKWLKTGIVMGPFDKQYAKKHDVTLNMLFGVPKPDGSTRPILNLSDKNIFGVSINELLDSKLCTVEYAQTKEVVEIVNALGKNAWLWAKDLKDGYYNVPIHEDDTHNLGFVFDNKIYIFIRLPMGLSSSPKIFTDFMKFPIWAIKNDRKDLYYIKVDPSTIDTNNFRKDSDITCNQSCVIMAIIFYYLDDILGGHRTKELAWKQFHHSEQILQRLSLKTKETKAKPPAQIQKWLGKIYDTRRQWLKLPADKVDKYTLDLQQLLNKKSVTQRELLRHIGRTRHMASIYRCLSAFARNLESWAYSVSRLSHHIKISKPLKNDINLCIWAMNRASLYGISFEHFLRPVDRPDITIYTDASLKVGVGGISDKGHWFKNKWSDIHFPDAKNRDIVWRELAAIYTFVSALKSQLSNKTIHIYTDNEACKFMLIKMRSKLSRPDLQLLINELCKLFIEFEINHWIEHIPGKENVIADALSRFQPIPSHSFSFNCSRRINAVDNLQNAANICKDITINNKHLIMKDI